jgi:hypothetical protein
MRASLSAKRPDHDREELLTMGDLKSGAHLVKQIHACQQAFYSYFTGASSKSVLNIMANLNYNDAEMGHRRELINRCYA